MSRKFKFLIIGMITLSVALVVNIYLKNYNDMNQEHKDEITFSYKRPIVPDGFKKVETTNASWELDEEGNIKGWNDGLAIEDEVGNQFVWVPVENKEFTILQSEANLLQDEESQEEIEQIEKYGGFYIGRYEAGIPEHLLNKVTYSSDTNDVEGVPVVKKDSIPWNYISLKNAKNNATSMYNNKSVKSDLITTRQWLKTMEWLYNSKHDIYNPASFGNFAETTFYFTGKYSENSSITYSYANNMLKNNNFILATGISERNCTNNIYDLAGNLMEYTNGYVSTRGYYSVGGHFSTTSDYGIYSPRLIGTDPLDKLGFRIVLYLK